MVTLSEYEAGKVEVAGVMEIVLMQLVFEKEKEKKHIYSGGDEGVGE